MRCCKQLLIKSTLASIVAYYVNLFSATYIIPPTVGESHFLCDDSDIATETCLGKNIELITAFLIKVYIVLCCQQRQICTVASILAHNINLALNLFQSLFPKQGKRIQLNRLELAFRMVRCCLLFIFSYYELSLKVHTT